MATKTHLGEVKGRSRTVPKLSVISVREFAGRFANGVRVSQQPFTWFFGAGCSKSSSISDAGGLVEKWLKELFDLQGHSGVSFEAWLAKEFPMFDSNNPSKSYAEAFARRHPSPVERQREIEMICSRGEPAYGYATLAQLLSHKDYGRFCNTVLTTNFDDLIADALYLYGERNARPLVVTHEALARYVRTNSPRPTVVKLHGDAHLDPKNLQPETREIDVGLAKQLYPFLQDHALVFVGYAIFLDRVRNDKDAAETFYKRAIEADPKHHAALSNYATLLHQVRNDDDGAEPLYKRAIDSDPSGAVNLCNYADFIEKVRKNFDEAEALYKRTLELDPEYLYGLEKYAGFLEKVRKDSKAAAEYFSRAKKLEVKSG
jgi:tetratricopeptide (TPR) repeat protein